MSTTHTPPHDDGEWFSTERLAAWLDCSVQSIYLWRHKGTGPRAHKVGKHLRFRRCDVEDWLAEHADHE